MLKSLKAKIAAKFKFTLIEMMVVIGVIIFVAAITLPGIMPVWRSQNVRAGRMILQNGISAARAYAIKNKVICALGVYNYTDEGETRGAINMFVLEGAQARYWIGNPGAADPRVDNWGPGEDGIWDSSHCTGSPPGCTYTGDDENSGDGINDADQDGTNGNPGVDDQEYTNMMNSGSGSTTALNAEEWNARQDYLLDRLIEGSWKPFPFGVSAFSKEREVTYGSTVQYVAMITFYSNGSMIPPGYSPGNLGYTNISARIEKGSSDYTIRGWRVYHLTGHLKSTVDSYLVE